VVSGAVMTSIAPTVQAFFTDRLTTQRQASPRTIAAYRDTLRLLLGFVHRRTGKLPSQQDWHDMDATMISAFLDTWKASEVNALIAAPDQARWDPGDEEGEALRPDAVHRYARGQVHGGADDRGWNSRPRPPDHRREMTNPAGSASPSPSFSHRAGSVVITRHTGRIRCGPVQRHVTGGPDGPDRESPLVGGSPRWQ
jgi:Phage integrase, N-terminal SAM-like domain